MDYENFNKIPEEKKNSILQSAMEEFAKNGYSGASTNAIISRAGISKGILFHYFGSKKGLFLYIHEGIINRFLNQIENEIKSVSGFKLYENAKTMFMSKATFFVEHNLEFDFIYRANLDPAEEIKNEIRQLNIKLGELMMRQRLDLVKRSIDATKLRDDLPLEAAVDCVMLAMDALSTKFNSLYRTMKLDLLKNPDVILNQMKVFLDVVCHGLYKRE